MASVDIFGKPISGNQHSDFYNKLMNPNKQVQLTPKQRFDLEKAKVTQLKQANKYQAKLNKMEDARLKLQVANLKNKIRNPQIIERTNSKINILKGFFK